MASDLRRVLGPLEADVVEALWFLGAPSTVREVLDRLNTERAPQLAYTTVMTVMTRLAEKGVLVRESRGRGYVYEPVVRSAAELAVRDVVREYGNAAVAQFVAEARADPKLMRRLQKLIDDER